MQPMLLMRNFIAIWLISLLVLPGPSAHAHGDLNVDEDACKLRLGPHLIHFTGYQPEQRLGQEFCEDIPVTGRTIMVFDAVDDTLRQTKIAVRIVEDAGHGPHGDESARLLAAVGPEAFTDGTINLEYDFPDKGAFVGIVTAEVNGSPGTTYVGRFPFSVGVGSGVWSQAVELLFWVSLVVVGVYFLSTRSERRRRSQTGLPS